MILPDEIFGSSSRKKQPQNEQTMSQPYSKQQKKASACSSRAIPFLSFEPRISGFRAKAAVAGLAFLRLCDHPVIIW